MINALKKCLLFKGIEDLEYYVNFFENSSKVAIKEINEGENVFHMMDEARVIGIILEGEIQVEKILPSGVALTIATKKIGNMIGEAAVFSNMGQYPCELTALKKSKIIFISREELLELLQRDKKILENFLTELSSMTYALQSKVELLSHSGITEKIAYFLLEKSRETNSDVINMPTSMTAFAEILNVSRTSLHREVKKLIKAGAIKIVDKKIVIEDKNKLENYSA